MSAQTGGVGARISELVARVLGVIEPLMRGIQRLVGAGRMPWVFLAPNLLIFGAFTFVPIVINFLYAFSGGVNLYPSERPYVGMENLATLFECTNYLDPST